MYEWRCPACGEVFKNRHQLIGHLLSAHNDEKEQKESEYVYFCKYCNAEFRDENAHQELVEHLITEHAEEIEKDEDLDQETKEKLLKLIEARRKLENEQKKETTEKQKTQKSQKK